VSPAIRLELVFIVGIFGALPQLVISRTLTDTNNIYLTMIVSPQVLGGLIVAPNTD